MPAPRELARPPGRVWEPRGGHGPAGTLCFSPPPSRALAPAPSNALPRGASWRLPGRASADREPRAPRGAGRPRRCPERGIPARPPGGPGPLARGGPAASLPPENLSRRSRALRSFGPIKAPAPGPPARDAGTGTARCFNAGASAPARQRRLTSGRAFGHSRCCRALMAGPPGGSASAGCGRARRRGPPGKVFARAERPGPAPAWAGGPRRARETRKALGEKGPAQPGPERGPGREKRGAQRAGSPANCAPGPEAPRKQKQKSAPGGLAQARGEAAGRPGSPKGSPRVRGAAAELSPKGRRCFPGVPLPSRRDPQRCARLFSALLWPWYCFLSPPWRAGPAPRSRLVGWEIRQGGLETRSGGDRGVSGAGAGPRQHRLEPCGQGPGPGAVRAPPSLWE